MNKITCQNIACSRIFTPRLKTQKHCSALCGNRSKHKEYEKIHREMAFEYAGTKCIRCGYNECREALHFHHLVPENKIKSVSDMYKNHSWAHIKLEIDKCVLLCSNCHIKTHVDMRNRKD